jgi:hypothetical protein
MTMSHPAPEVITTRERLVSLLFEPSMKRKLVKVKDTVGYVSAIEREDGSGYCFNVTMYPYIIPEDFSFPAVVSDKVTTFIRFDN